MSTIAAVVDIELCFRRMVEVLEQILLGLGWLVAVLLALAKPEHLFNLKMARVEDEVSNAISSLNKALMEHYTILEQTLVTTKEAIDQLEASIEQFNKDLAKLSREVNQLEKAKDSINGQLGGLQAQLKDIRRYLLEIRREIRRG